MEAKSFWYPVQVGSIGLTKFGVDMNNAGNWIPPQEKGKDRSEQINVNPRTGEKAH